MPPNSNKFVIVDFLSVYNLAPTVGPRLSKKRHSTNELSTMSHLDNVTVDDVLDEVEVAAQLRALTAQMKETAEKIQRLEEENRSVHEENTILKGRMESLVQQEPSLETPTPGTISSRHQDPGSSSGHARAIDARRLTFEDAEGVNPVTPNPQRVSDTPTPIQQSAPVVMAKRVSFGEASPTMQTELPPRQIHSNVSLSDNVLTPFAGSGTYNDELASRLINLEEKIQRIPGVPAPIKKSLLTSFADSPFVDAIALVEMPIKFSFPVMKLYDGTTDPDDHVSQYKQRMFTIAIPRDLREACMCKGFGSRDRKSVV